MVETAPEFFKTYPNLRYHGLVYDMPDEARVAIDLLAGAGILAGSETVTIGPSEVEIEFPLHPSVAAIFNRHGNRHSRPKGCRDAFI